MSLGFNTKPCPELCFVLFCFFSTGEIMTKILYKSFIESLLCFSWSVDFSAQKCSNIIDHAREIIRAKQVLCVWQSCVTDKLCTVGLTIFLHRDHLPVKYWSHFPFSIHVHPPPDKVHGYKHVESSGIN